MAQLKDKTEEREFHRLARMVGRTARLLDKGLSTSEIAVELNKPEFSVREWVSIIRAARKPKVN